MVQGSDHHPGRAAPYASRRLTYDVFVDEPKTLSQQRVKHLLRDLADEPFIALVIPEQGDVKVYVKGVSPDKMAQIQRFVEDVLADRV